MESLSGVNREYKRPICGTVPGIGIDGVEWNTQGGVDRWTRQNRWHEAPIPGRLH